MYGLFEEFVVVPSPKVVDVAQYSMAIYVSSPI